MTRWAIVADLNRCVGCQTCTAACKHANNTAPGVQWRKVLDFEAGEFPDVRRAFMPTGCMHCDDAPCLDVCPTTATRKREDGIVTIDYDLCIGCAYCVVACPYGARTRVDLPSRAFGGKQMKHEELREDPARLGVSQKCTFCSPKVDAGLARGLVPGVDADATPACVNACIAGALHFGDADDPESNISQLKKKNATFKMHEELGTGPNISYIYEKAGEADGAAGTPPMLDQTFGLKGVEPVHQSSWDWRAAMNFVCGGAAAGLFITAALGSFMGGPLMVPGLLALALMGLGLFCVWLEIGRPWRFLNVFLHPHRSWMTREAMVAMPFFALAFPAAVFELPWLALAATPFALAFVYAQARILQAAKGIPTWRQKQIVPLIVSTGLTEGVGLGALLATLLGAPERLLHTLAAVLLALILLRVVAWQSYRGALGRAGAPSRAFAALDGAALKLSLAHQAAPALLALVAIVMPGATLAFTLAGAGVLAVASGWVFKFGLITRAAFNQGYALNRFPARGRGDSAVGIKPGWSLS